MHLAKFSFLYIVIYSLLVEKGLKILTQKNMVCCLPRKYTVILSIIFVTGIIWNLVLWDLGENWYGSPFRNVPATVL